MPEATTKKGKKKHGPVLPPKPALYTEEEWNLAHSVPKLLELLAAPPDKGNGGSTGKEKPLVSKPKAALWLWQLLGSSSQARHEAFQAKAVEACCKLLCMPSTDPSCMASCLGCLTALAQPQQHQQQAGAAEQDDGEGAQAAAACEAILTAKPPLVPWLLRLLEQQPAVAPGVLAAALGLLHAVVACVTTRQLVGKLMAGWGWQPLLQALTSQKTMPLLGGRNAAADAAAIIELLCTPLPPPATAAGGSAAGGGSSGSAKVAKGSKEGSGATSVRAASASSKAASSAAAAAAGAGGGATLAAAVQRGVLEAEGMPALLKVCTAHGSTLSARCSAVAAVQQLMAAHGQAAATKQAFRAAGGLGTMVQLMARPGLPLPARAAAAGCIYSYLTPQPAAADAVSSGAALLHPVLQAGGHGTTYISSSSSSSSSGSRPGTSVSLSRSIVANAIRLRKGAAGGGSSSTDGGSAARASNSSSSNSSQQGTRDSSCGGAAAAAAAAVSSSSNGVRTLPTDAILGRAAADAGGPGHNDLVLPAAPGDAAAAAVVAAQAALLAAWDTPARQMLADCAEAAVQAGAIPGLLLLCCGPHGPPQALLAAADAAAGAAAAAVASSASRAACRGALPSSGGDSSGGSCSMAAASGVGPVSVPGSALPAATATTGMGAAAAAAAAAAGQGNDASLRVGDALDSIAEPTQASEGDGDQGDAAADSGLGEGGSGQDHGSGKAGGGGGKEKGSGKKGKKGGVKADPALEAAQEMASAAVQLLACSGDAARLALVQAGAMQALLALSLVASDHASSSSSSSTAANSGLLCADADAALPVKLPPYLSLSNMPASHWQLVAPLSLPPQPALPWIPGRSRGSEGTAAGGGGSAGGARPGSQGRRMSVSNLASTSATLGSRMSAASGYTEGGAAATQVTGSGAGTAGGSGGMRAKAPRASMTMVAAAAGPQPAGAIGGRLPASAEGTGRTSIAS